MYRTGTGVERDYRKAAEWAERYAQHLEKLMPDARERAADPRYVSAWLEAGRNLEFVMEDGKALRAYEKSLSGKMTAGDIASYVWQMEACYNAALLAERMGDHGLSKRLCDRYFTACNYCSVFDIYRIRAEQLAGSLAYRAGKWGEAVVHFEKGLELIEDQETDDPEMVYFKHLKAQFCQFLGSSYLRMGADADSAGIEDYFEQALDLYDEVEDQKFAGTEEGRMMIYHSLDLRSKVLTSKCPLTSDFSYLSITRISCSDDIRIYHYLRFSRPCSDM
jgi:tetratricopeptide (TPR) repeat protein